MEFGYVDSVSVLRGWSEWHCLNLLFMLEENSFYRAFEINFYMWLSHQFHTEICKQVKEPFEFLVFQLYFKQISKNFSSKHKEFIFIFFEVLSWFSVGDIRLRTQNDILRKLLQKVENQLDGSSIKIWTFMRCSERDLYKICDNSVENWTFRLELLKRGLGLLF